MMERADRAATGGSHHLLICRDFRSRREERLAQ